ncbi:hypothetical protein LB505_002346 [Fusarium chuoi]|nr:hypothetical protein LB505_002346 [Fusarium chuoi]
MGAHDTEGKRASPRSSPPLQEKSDQAGHDEQAFSNTATKTVVDIIAIAMADIPYPTTRRSRIVKICFIR